MIAARNLNRMGRRMKAIGNCFGVAFLLLALAGCSSKPILNIKDAPIPSGHTPDQVQKAIIAAGASYGWIMKEVQPGVIHGVLKLRTHEAEVDIAYSTVSYSITYANSVNLDYKAGNIHRNYNLWVTNLSRAIQTEISK
jgi:hypothetical protein